MAKGPGIHIKLILMITPELSLRLGIIYLERSALIMFIYISCSWNSKTQTILTTCGIAYNSENQARAYTLTSNEMAKPLHIHRMKYQRDSRIMTIRWR